MKTMMSPPFHIAEKVVGLTADDDIVVGIKVRLHRLLLHDYGFEKEQDRAGDKDGDNYISKPFVCFSHLFSPKIIFAKNIFFYAHKLRGKRAGKLSSLQVGKRSGGAAVRKDQPSRMEQMGGKAVSLFDDLIDEAAAVLGVTDEGMPLPRPAAV